MRIIKTKLEGCFIFEPKVFNDVRGYFFESFNQQTFSRLTGLNVNFIQDNEAFSNKGIIRGLHFQKADFAQAKLVRVIKGKVLDVAVDIRKNSRTYGQHISVILSETNKKQLFIPKGFAHGYAVLENETIFNYKCDNFYQPSQEGGIRFDDPVLNIDWVLSNNEIIVSEKDKNLPFFEKIIN